MVLYAAHKMDTLGNKAARKEIAMIKVIAPRMACEVIDKAIQVHGGGGVSQEFSLAYAYGSSRTLRLADGPAAVHLESIAKAELRKNDCREPPRARAPSAAPAARCSSPPRAPP